MIDTIGTILLLGAAQGVILALTLLTLKRGNRSANRVLAALLFFFSFSIVFHIVAHGFHLDDTLHHATTGKILFLFIAPLIYFYVKAQTTRAFQFSKQDLRHFLLIPAALLVVALGNIVWPQQALTKQTDLPVSPADLAMSALLFLQTISYLIWVVRLLRRHAQAIKNTFSSIEKINLNWLRILITGYMTVSLLALVLEGIGGDSHQWDVYWLVISAFMYAIAYMGLRQPLIFSGAYLENPETAPKEKYKKSTLSEENAQQYFHRLQELMRTQHPYLDADLSLPALAKQLSISKHHLSQVINVEAGQNFFDFVNHYRVEAAKTLIADPKKAHLNLSEIAYEVGFSSLSSFNSAFKKNTQSTPSQFKKQ